MTARVVNNHDSRVQGHSLGLLSDSDLCKLTSLKVIISSGHDYQSLLNLISMPASLIVVSEAVCQ